eukprot:bmy_01555T0
MVIDKFAGRNEKEIVTMSTPCPASRRSITAAADKIVDTSKSAFTFKASVSKLEIIFPNIQENSNKIGSRRESRQFV